MEGTASFQYCGRGPGYWSDRDCYRHDLCRFQPAPHRPGRYGWRAGHQLRHQDLQEGHRPLIPAPSAPASAGAIFLGGVMYET